MAMTPRRRSSGVRDSSFTKAPRSLKEPVACMFSYLTKTSAPVRAERRGAKNVGVWTTRPATSLAAFSMSSMVTLIRLSSDKARRKVAVAEKSSRSPDQQQDQKHVNGKVTIDDGK